MSVPVRAAALQGYETVVRTLGADPLPLLRRHGIDPDTLRNPEALIPLGKTIQLLEETASATRCPDFGLRLAAAQDSNALGLLSVVMHNAPTIAQALADASRYLFLHSPAYEVVLDPVSPLSNACVTLRFGIQLGEFTQQRQIVDGCLGVTYRLLCQFGVEPNRVRAVWLPHAPLAAESVYRRFFGAPVHFAQPYAGLHVDGDALKTDLKSVNPLLRQLALDYIAQGVVPHNDHLSDRVRQALQRTMGTGRGTKAQIAQLLGTHPRTLQRRLDREGASFEAIRERVYKEAALRLLRETDIPLKQLAGNLGFSEQSAFTRSCRRWFGAPPSEIRPGLTPQPE